MEQPFTWDPEKDTMWEALGITEERYKKMNWQMSLAVHRFNEPTEEGVIEIEPAKAIRTFLDLGETLEEKLFAAYRAGRYIQEELQEARNPIASHLKGVR